MRFEHTVKTTAAPARVWAVWVDVARWHEWDNELVSASIEREQIALGAEGSLRPKSGPVSSFIISDFVPKRYYAFTTRLPLCALIIHRQLSEDSDGGTIFTHEVAFIGPLAIRPLC